MDVTFRALSPHLVQAVGNSTAGRAWVDRNTRPSERYPGVGTVGTDELVGALKSIKAAKLSFLTLDEGK